MNASDAADERDPGAQGNDRHIDMSINGVLESPIDDREHQINALRSRGRTCSIASDELNTQREIEAQHGGHVYIPAQCRPSG